MAKTFNDPIFSSQWYLVNTGQRGAPGLDINVLSAWDKYTGKGVVVSVNDDGMDLTHPAMVANLLTNLTYDVGRDTVGQGFVDASSDHGTVVGSIVGMAGNDGIGGVGVAYEAKIVPATAFGSSAGEGSTAKLFLANLAAGAAVSVNSWGKDPAFAENFGASGSQADQDWGAALLRAATEARNGLGMVIEVSGGNERGNNADTALSNFTGNKLTIAVGAVTSTGLATDYSTRGASLLLSALGGVGSEDQSADSGYGIASADIQGANGYNKTDGIAGDYAYQNQGTSYSGPMVGGAAALMLQANPKLGFRDVSAILAMTARQVDVGNSSWTLNASSDWNLGGMHFSRDFGYGLLDVSAAVRLAESWNQTSATVANWQSAEGKSATASGSIPDNDAAGFTAIANVANNVRIDRVEFDLNLTATNPSELSATITSPGGTTITLFDQPLTRDISNGAPDMSTPESAWPATFTIGATAFLGESSAGTWTLKLTDKVTGEEASFNALTVRAWGSTITANSQYVLTNEFSKTNATLTDTSGIDTVNAAALATGTQIDLRAGSTSKVGSGQFTIAASSVIENAIGGLGADTITGNDTNNVLRGNAGDDNINGGAGADMAVYTSARSAYTVTKTATGLSVRSADEGTDTLVNVERLQFSDATIAMDIVGNGGQAYRIYQAALNRAPDAGGLGYWINVLDSGVSLTSVAQGFVTSPEFVSLYGANPTNVELVTKFYSNVLHRTPDTDGLNYWLGILDSNALSVAGVLAEFGESPENQAALVGVIGNGFVYTPLGG